MLKLDWGCLYIPLRRLHFALFPFFFFNHRNREQNLRSKSSFSLEAINKHRNRSQNTFKSIFVVESYQPKTQHESFYYFFLSLNRLLLIHTPPQNLFKVIGFVRSYQPPSKSLTKTIQSSLRRSKLPTQDSARELLLLLLVFEQTFFYPRLLTELVQSHWFQ